jgi:hypothetical protein
LKSLEIVLKTPLAGLKMAQLHEITLAFEILARTPSTVIVSTENSKAAVILARYAILEPPTAAFRFILYFSPR